MFTTVAFSESIDAAGAFVRIAGVPDQHVKVIGDSVIISEFNRLMGGLACIGTNAAEARFISPSLRRVNPLYITPVIAGLVPGATYGHSVSPNLSNVLDVSESLECDINATPVGAEQVSVVAWLSTAPIDKLKGQIITVNAEITVTLVAGRWAFSEIVFEDDLPVKDFDIVGARLVCAAGVAFRFVFVGKTNRPGAPCSAAKATLKDRIFRYGNLGLWGAFSSVQPPGVEVLGSAAAGSATYQIYIDILSK